MDSSVKLKMKGRLMASKENERMDKEDDEDEKLSPAEIVDFITLCRDEADEAKTDRLDKNKNNYDMFHLKHDFSHKEEGQSEEILSRQSMAVESTKAFFQQALADFGDWWSAESCYPDAEAAMKVKPHEITKLTNYMLERAGYYSHVGNSIETALLSSLVIAKVGGRYIPKPKYVAKKKGRGKGLTRWVEKTNDKTWELNFSIVRAENYYPDPKPGPIRLYEIEDSWVDVADLRALMMSDDDFDMELYDKVASSPGLDEHTEDFGRARETGHNVSNSSARKRVKLTEFWGSILNSEGEIVFENVQAIVANDVDLILPPRPNPLWHQTSPYRAAPLIEVANSVWHKALMDAPTQHNRALIEMYNLMVDAAMMQVHGISQLRKDWLDNPAQVVNGIKPGMALIANAMCPPGAKVLEPLFNVVIPPEAFNVFGIVSQEFNSSALTSDLRSGMNAGPNTSATAIVEQSQTITSVFTGMAKNYEAKQITKELEASWMTTAQNWNDIDREVFVSLFGAQRGEELYRLPATEVFASTVSGIRFRVYGITQTLGKAQDFQKLTTLLQTVASSPVLLEEFFKKYDLGRLLGEIMTALDIDKHKLEIPEEVQRTMGGGDAGAPVAGPQDMSQVADAGSLNDYMTGTETPGIPQTSFPGSPALIGGNQ